MLELILATEIGIGAGPCDIQGELAACDSGSWATHVYIKSDIWRYKDFAIGAEYHHFSRPEVSDLTYGGGTGAFDYGGVYIRYRFDGIK